MATSTDTEALPNVIAKDDWLINVTGLCKNFDHKPVIKNVNLRVKQGEIFGFLGPNGAGKTTIIRMLCGLLKPDAGEGHCFGYDIHKQATLIKAKFGYMSQYFSLYKDLTIYENLDLIADLYGVSDKKARIHEMLERLSLVKQQKILAGTLSGGFKQRLALAAALLPKPLLLILDEPTANVDYNVRQNFWEQMHQLTVEGTTIILSSHNMDEIKRCQRIAYICNGMVVETGTVKEIFAKTCLTTWLIQGEKLEVLALELKEYKSIMQIIAFSDCLRISNQDAAILEQVLAPYLKNSGYTWRKVDSNLEDIFVWLTRYGLYG